VALHVEPGLAGVLVVPVVAGNGLALHLHGPAKVLLPVLGGGHLLAGVDVAHDEAGVVPVLVREDLRHLQPS